MKQPFICPQCGHESDFDPWVAAARCPRCGYSPSPPPSGTDARFFGESDRRLSWVDAEATTAEEGDLDTGATAGDREPPAARLLHCPRCGHKSLILAGEPLRCSDCRHRPRPGEGQVLDLTLADLQELLGSTEEPGRGPELHLKVGESDQTYHRLRQQFREKAPLRVFECPSCGRQSVFRTDELPYCAWCGHAAGSRTRSRIRQPAIEEGKQVSSPGWTDVLSVLAPSNLGRLFGGLMHLARSDVRLTLGVLFLTVWGLLLLFAFSRDLRESVGHKLQLMFSATSTTEGRVVERFEQRAQKGPSNYYVTYRYSVPGADGQVQEFTNRERVKWSLYDRLESGATVTIRYADRDPSIASISGNEGLCFGTTCLTLLVLLVVVFTLYAWASKP